MYVFCTARNGMSKTHTHTHHHSPHTRISHSHGKSGCVRTDTYACLPYTIRTISSLESLSISSNVFLLHARTARGMNCCCAAVCVRISGGKKIIEFYFSKIVHSPFMEIKIISHAIQAVQLLVNSEKLTKIPKNRDFGHDFAASNSTPCSI